MDFLFSGQKFKIRIDTENCYIGFSLIGIKIPIPDQNQPEITEISNTVKEFAKTLLHQRDVVVNIKYINKKGTFLGNMWIGNDSKKSKGENYAKVLLPKWFGDIQDTNSDKQGKITIKF